MPNSVIDIVYSDIGYIKQNTWWINFCYQVKNIENEKVNTTYDYDGD